MPLDNFPSSSRIRPNTIVWLYLHVYDLHNIILYSWYIIIQTTVTYILSSAIPLHRTKTQYTTMYSTFENARQMLFFFSLSLSNVYYPIIITIWTSRLADDVSVAVVTASRWKRKILSLWRTARKSATNRLYPSTASANSFLPIVDVYLYTR